MLKPYISTKISINKQLNVLIASSLCFDTVGELRNIFSRVPKCTQLKSVLVKLCIKCIIIFLFSLISFLFSSSFFFFKIVFSFVTNNLSFWD